MIKYMLNQTLTVLLKKKIIMGNAKLLYKPWQPQSTPIRLLPCQHTTGRQKRVGYRNKHLTWLSRGKSSP